MKIIATVPVISGEDMDQFKELCCVSWVQERWEPKVGDMTNWGYITHIISLPFVNVERAYTPKNINDLTYLPRIDEMLGWLPEDVDWLFRKNRFEKGNRKYIFFIKAHAFYGSTAEIAVLKGVAHELGES